MKRRRAVKTKARKAARREGGRGPSNKSKDSKVKKLIRLAKSGNRSGSNLRAQSQFKRR